MSPHKRKKLSKIRSELDKLDNTLIKVIKKRTILVNKVLALKDKKNQIVDQRRINLILKNIKKKSIQNKIDPKITNRIWKNMIWSYINYEKRNFKKKITIYCGVEVSFQQKLHVYEWQDYTSLLLILL